MLHTLNVATVHLADGRTITKARVEITDQLVTVQDRRGNTLITLAVAQDPVTFSERNGLRLEHPHWQVVGCNGEQWEIENTGGCGGCGGTVVDPPFERTEP